MRRRALPVLALAATAAAALAFALAQPIGAPWWLYADADASYASSALRLAAREPAGYFDHPGFPLQELLAYTFEARWIAAGAPPQATWAEGQMQSLQSSTPYWRGLAVALYVLAALVACVVVARLLGGWGWGLAGGLLWLGAPSLAPMAIQYRPDVLLSALTLAVALLVVRGAQHRDPLAYIGAAALIGFTTTVKAIGPALIAPLAVAVAFWPPSPEGAEQRVGAWIRRRSYALAFAVVAAAVLVWWFSRGELPPPTTSEEQRLVLVSAALIGAYGTAAWLASRVTRRHVVRRLLDPFVALAAVAFCAGALAPAALFPAEGLAMLLHVEQTWQGGGVNSGLQLFAFPHDQFLHWPLQQAVVVFVLAVAAAVVAAAGRHAMPVALAAGAAVVIVLGLARQGTSYYFAPAYLLSVPPALWLLRSRIPRLAPAATAALVLYVTVPQLLHVRDPAHAAARAERQSSVMVQDAAQLLGPRQAVLVDQGAPTPDSRYNGLVENFVEGAPPHPRAWFFDDFWKTPDWLRARRLTLRYYMGRRALGVTGKTKMQFDVGRYTVEPLPSYTRRDLGFGVLELVSGPGIDRPYPSLNSPA